MILDEQPSDEKPAASEAIEWLSVVNECQVTSTTPGGNDYNNVPAPYLEALTVVRNARAEADAAEAVSYAAK